MFRLCIRNVLAWLLVCSSACGIAYAMTAMNDEDLSTVTAQDGVSIMAELNMSIGSFSYSTQSASNPGGGTLNLNNISISGLLPLNIDVMSSASFTAALNTYATAYGADGAANLTRFLSSGAYDGKSDVIQLAIPNTGMAGNSGLNVAVNSITLGNSNTPLTSLSLSNLDLQGSKIWIWAH